MPHNISESFNKLLQYCDKEDYKGWDPFDGLNSSLFQNSQLKNYKIMRLIWIQFFKKSSINFRELLKVTKDYNPKALGLFLYSYSQLAKCNSLLNELNISVDAVNEKIAFFAKKIISLKSSSEYFSSWGYNFDWQNRVFFQPKNTPTVVATSFVSDALLEAYEHTKNEKYLDVALDSAKFVVNNLNRYECEDGIIFSYSPLDNSRVFNASLLGARLLARSYFYTGNKEYKDLAKKAVNYVAKNQNKDGSWIYGENKVQNWVDSFHTGYNLECIYEYGKYTSDFSYSDTFEIGFVYYLKNFFLIDGTPKYFNNKIYPIDIHSPAQFIVTLAKTKRLKDNYPLASKVLEWTIKNMQNKAGYFYYQKNKYFTSRIPYMRWSQAWMFYAFTNYLMETNIENLD